MSDIEIQKFDRVPILREQMECMLRWTYGNEGSELARLWCSFNDQLFEGRLSPVPIFQPTASPFGRWIGLYQGNDRNESLLIQLLRGESREEKFAVLLHEMIHQCLHESGENPNHNSIAWCNQIMRLTREVWKLEIWAAPSLPRKIKGASVRVQKSSPDGKPSITRKQIASWPQSLGLQIPVERFVGVAKQ